ncbi:MAG: hypothetical protein EP330_22250 [Deltaproteobacteria bacterium]|nr:MAG: hypothetical protein EP330_22250 [Deltaproteobacteria bacterium]
MRKTLALAFLLAAPAAFAAGSASHNVSVQLLELTDIAIQGGDVSIVLDQFDPGTNWVLPEFDESTSLEFRHTSAAAQKVTVETDNAAPSFALSVTAQAPSNGASAGQVALSTTAADFITGINAGQGGAGLRYDASAPMGSAAGTDAHVITYTILAM